MSETLITVIVGGLIGILGAIVGGLIGGLIGYYSALSIFNRQEEKEKKVKKLEKLEELYRVIDKNTLPLQLTLKNVESFWVGRTTYLPKLEPLEQLVLILRLLTLYGPKEFEKKYSSALSDFAEKYDELSDAKTLNELETALENLQNIINEIRWKIEEIFSEEYGIELSKGG